jgi:hypothetical protein
MGWDMGGWDLDHDTNVYLTVYEHEDEKPDHEHGWLCGICIARLHCGGIVEVYVRVLCVIDETIDFEIDE